MKFERTTLPEVILCKPEVIADARGYFMESFRQDLLDDFLGASIHFCQDNEAKSNRGVLRGLHYQIAPKAQAKLVRVIRGAVLDVVVDIRKDSENFGKHFITELNEINKYQLFIPKGFAHGYITLEDNTIFTYKVDEYYSSACERGIMYNDAELNINWQSDGMDLIISEKDTRQPLFSEATYF